MAMASASRYEQQIRQTAQAVAAQAGRTECDIAWQSRSGPPGQPWLEPDILVYLRAQASAGVTDVVVAPIGFLSDHMEVLYDLDVEAAAVCRELGINMVRARSAGLHPLMIRMFRELVQQWMASEEAPGCASDCCPAPRITHGR
jgi:ferrochelatase